MSLDYVKKGESVKASTVNSLIDAIGGNQRMSPDLNITTTKNGPQVSLPSNYGGPNHKPNELLDVGRYQLSGWPMTQLFLGPEIDDCLNAIRLHKPDGTVQTSVSAAIVFKNSANCPTGDELSGYLLSSDQFGYDRERHASGWLPTMIEDPYCGNYMGAQLWQYEDGKKLATVFTNVESDLSVKSALSSLFEGGGADSEGLSSISKIDAWQLVDSTFLSAEISGQTRWISTHEHVKNHGQIDVYQSEGQDYRVVLKCSLKCVGVQESDPDPQTGETHIESTKWAWSIPLGPDASSNDGKAHSTCVTYGGNPVVFEVEEGEVGDDYDGTATYDNGEITFGLFEAEAGEPIDPGELWLVLKYDYQKKAVMGEFSDQTDSGSYTQDGILSRNVFVISGGKFTPSTDETQVGTKAPIDILTYGTWGVLPKDGPKLDTYCKRDEETEFKSLDWADLKGEDAECQCAEIYKFDQLDFTADPLSTDHIIVRRPDENGGGAEVKYVPLSSLEISGMYVPPDADVEDAQTSSLQTRELDNGSRVEELFQFHLSDTVDLRISDLLSVDVVIRNPNNGQPYVEYGKLCVDIMPDTQGNSGQKSIDWLGETHELQLYKFDDLGGSINVEMVADENGLKTKLPDEDNLEFVLRRNGAGGEVDYATIDLSVSTEQLSTALSAVLSGLVISGDTNYNDNVFKQKSIHTIELSGKTFHQLYKMDKPGMDEHLKVSFTPGPDDGLSCLLPGPDLSGNQLEFVVRRNGAGGEIDYAMIDLSASLSAISSSISSTIATQISESAISGDVNNNDNEFTQKSIHTVELSGKTYHQLYKMDEDGHAISADIPTYFDSAKNPLDEITSNCEFVIRKGGPGGEIDYVDLSLRQAQLSVDSDGTQKSVQYNPTTNELQLYKMHENGEAGNSVTITSAMTSLLPSNYELVVRKGGAGGQIEYTKLSVALSGAIELDIQATAQQKSLEWKTQNNRTYAQLYKMDAAGEPTEQVDLKFAKDSYQDLLPDDEEFVIRSAQGGEIKYKNVGVLLSAYSGGGGGGSADLSVDSEIPALKHSSLQHVVQGGNDYYELYGFHDSTNTQTSLSGYEYVVRHNDGNGNVSVKYLSADLAQASCPASFDYYTRPDGTHWLRGGYFQQARRFYWVSSTEITMSGMIQLSVSMEYTSRSGIIQGASSLPSPTVSAMYIPLWEIGQDMKPTFDYRHTPMLPRWE